MTRSSEGFGGTSLNTDALAVPATEATIDFSKDKTYRSFKLAYHAALGSKEHPQAFNFEGHDILVQYAKYLLQYVEGQRKNHRLKYFDSIKRQWKANYPVD